MGYPLRVSLRHARHEGPDTLLTDSLLPGSGFVCHACNARCGNSGVSEFMDQREGDNAHVACLDQRTANLDFTTIAVEVATSMKRTDSYPVDTSNESSVANWVLFMNHPDRQLRFAK